jgi:transcriptional regulator with XRE-family HTH domain
MQSKKRTLVVFAARLDGFMREKGVTQMQLAKEFGVSQSAVSKWLKGTVPSGETLVRMGIFFGVTPETLVGLESFYEAGRARAKESPMGQGGNQSRERQQSPANCDKDVEALVEELQTGSLQVSKTSLHLKRGVLSKSCSIYSAAKFLTRANGVNDSLWGWGMV